MAKKKKGMFGVSDDVMSLGVGIVGAGIVTTAINKFSHGKHREGGEGGEGGAMDKMSDYIGEISGKMGIPKPAFIKGAVGIGFVFAAEKMPQYRTSFLFIAGVLLWDAITSHHKVRSFMGIHGTTLAGTEEINAIEADLRKELAEYKEALNGYPGSPSLEGYPGSPSVAGVLAGNMFGHETNFSALGI